MPQWTCRFWLCAIWVAGLACQRAEDPSAPTTAAAPLETASDIPTPEGDERFAAEPAIEFEFENLRGIWQFYDRWGNDRWLTVIKEAGHSAPQRISPGDSAKDATGNAATGNAATGKAESIADDRPATSSPDAGSVQPAYLFVFDGGTGMLGLNATSTPEHMIQIGEVGRAKLINPQQLHVIMRIPGNSVESVVYSFDRVYTRLGAN